MLTTDLALRMDPIYEPISRRFMENPDEFRRDARPGSMLPPRHGSDLSLPRPRGACREMIWQDPVPAGRPRMVDDADIASLKGKVLDSGLSISSLVSAAWASASTFRNSDKRAGQTVPVRLAPIGLGRPTTRPSYRRCW